MRNLDTLFTYRQPADAKRDRSGSVGESVVAEAKKLAKVIQEHVVDETASDAAIDGLKLALDIALDSIAGVMAKPVPPPPQPVPTMGPDPEPEPEPEPTE
jgi:hypothetical protein